MIFSFDHMTDENRELKNLNGFCLEMVPMTFLETIVVDYRWSWYVFT